MGGNCNGKLLQHKQIVSVGLPETLQGDHRIISVCLRGISGTGFNYCHVLADW